MAETITQIEAVPSAYPDPPTGLTTDAAALDASVIWARIEGYIAHRFAARSVVWIVEGEGDWTPPLIPATIGLAEKWEGDAWVTVTLPEGPYGSCLPSDGPYRITASVGGGDLPAPVSEAFRRLAEYSVDANESNMLTGRPGASGHTGNLGEGLSESIDRNPAWVAKAMQWSGAADLLRNYRRAA